MRRCDPTCFQFNAKVMLTWFNSQFQTRLEHFTLGQINKAHIGAITDPSLYPVSLKRNLLREKEEVNPAFTDLALF